RTRRALDEIILEFGDEIDLESSDLKSLPARRGPNPKTASESVEGATDSGPAAEFDANRQFETDDRPDSDLTQKDAQLAEANERIHELEQRIAELTNDP